MSMQKPTTPNRVQSCSSGAGLETALWFERCSIMLMPDDQLADETDVQAIICELRERFESEGVNNE